MGSVYSRPRGDVDESEDMEAPTAAPTFVPRVLVSSFIGSRAKDFDPLPSNFLETTKVTSLENWSLKFLEPMPGKFLIKVIGKRMDPVTGVPKFWESSSIQQSLSRELVLSTSGSVYRAHKFAPDTFADYPLHSEIALVLETVGFPADWALFCKFCKQRRSVDEEVVGEEVRLEATSRKPASVDMSRSKPKPAYSTTTRLSTDAYSRGSRHSPNRPGGGREEDAIVSATPSRRFLSQSNSKTHSKDGSMSDRGRKNVEVVSPSRMYMDEYEEEEDETSVRDRRGYERSPDVDEEEEEDHRHNHRHHHHHHRDDHDEGDDDALPTQSPPVKSRPARKTSASKTPNSSGRAKTHKRGTLFNDALEFHMEMAKLERKRRASLKEDPSRLPPELPFTITVPDSPTPERVFTTRYGRHVVKPSSDISRSRKVYDTQGRFAGVSALPAFDSYLDPFASPIGSHIRTSISGSITIDNAIDTTENSARHSPPEPEPEPPAPVVITTTTPTTAPTSSRPAVSLAPMMRKKAKTQETAEEEEQPPSSSAARRTAAGKASPKSKPSEPSPSPPSASQEIDHVPAKPTPATAKKSAKKTATTPKPAVSPKSTESVAMQVDDVEEEDGKKKDSTNPKKRKAQEELKEDGGEDDTPPPSAPNSPQTRSVGRAKRSAQQPKKGSGSAAEGMTEATTTHSQAASSKATSQPSLASSSTRHLSASRSSNMKSVDVSTYSESTAENGAASKLSTSAQKELDAEIDEILSRTTTKAPSPSSSSKAASSPSKATKPTATAATESEISRKLGPKRAGKSTSTGSYSPSAPSPAANNQLAPTVDQDTNDNDAMVPLRQSKRKKTTAVRPSPSDEEYEFAAEPPARFNTRSTAKRTADNTNRTNSKNASSKRRNDHDYHEDSDDDGDQDEDDSEDYIAHISKLSRPRSSSSNAAAPLSTSNTLTDDRQRTAEARGDEWSEEHNRQLMDAIVTLDPSSLNYLSQLARKVPGKTPQQIQARLEHSKAADVGHKELSAPSSKKSLTAPSKSTAAQLSPLKIDSDMTKKKNRRKLEQAEAEIAKDLTGDAFDDPSFRVKRGFVQHPIASSTPRNASKKVDESLYRQDYAADDDDDEDLERNAETDADDFLDSISSSRSHIDKYRQRMSKDAKAKMKAQLPAAKKTQQAKRTKAPMDLSRVTKLLSSVESGIRRSKDAQDENDEIEDEGGIVVDFEDY